MLLTLLSCLGQPKETPHDFLYKELNDLSQFSDKNGNVSVYYEGDYAKQWIFDFCDELDGTKDSVVNINNARNNLQSTSNLKGKLLYSIHQSLNSLYQEKQQSTITIISTDSQTYSLQQGEISTKVQALEGVWRYLDRLKGE